LLLLLLLLSALFLLSTLFLLSSQLFPFLITLALILCSALSLIVCFGLPTEAAATRLTLVAVL